MPIRDIALGQLGGGNDGRIGNIDPMMHFVALFETPQNRDGVLFSGLVHQNLLEAAFEGRILLDMLAVLVERSRPHAMQFAASQGGLEHITGVHGTFGLAGADHGMQLIDKENDTAFLLAQLLENRLQALLKLAPVFGTRKQGPHIQAEYAFVLEAFGHLAIDNALGQALDNGGLAHARLPDQHRVVFRPARQDLHGAADFLIAANDGIELAVPRRLSEVARIALQRIVSLFCRRCIRRAPFTNIGDRFVEFNGGNASLFQDLRRASIRLHRQRGQEPFGGYIFIAGFLADFLSRPEYLRRGRRHINLAVAALYLRQFRQRFVRQLQCFFRLAARGANKVRGEPLLIVQERFQDVFGCELLMAVPQGDGLRGLNETACAVRIVFKLHLDLSLSVKGLKAPQ